MTTCTCNEEVCPEWCLLVQEYEAGWEDAVNSADFQRLFDRNLHNLMFNYLIDLDEKTLQKMMIEAHKKAKYTEEMLRRTREVVAMTEALNDA